MKEKIESFGKKVRDFIKAHWIDILVAIVSAFLGAVIENWLDSRRIKTFSFGELFSNAEYNPEGDAADNMHCYKVRIDVKGNNVMKAPALLSYATPNKGEFTGVVASHDVGDYFNSVGIDIFNK